MRQEKKNLGFPKCYNALYMGHFFGPLEGTLVPACYPSQCPVEMSARQGVGCPISPRLEVGGALESTASE